MRRTSDNQLFARAGKQAHGVTRLDRETLEVVMREDVFRAVDGKALAADGNALAADGKGLAVHLPEIWTRTRRGRRRV